MNNLNLILDKIDAECSSRIDALNRDKDAKIDEIAKAADDRVGDIFRRAEGTAIREYESAVSRAESSGKLAAREIVLGAKSAVLEQVYADAEKFIRSLPDDEYVLVLSRLLAGAVIERQEAVAALVEKYGEEEYGAEAKVPFDAAFSPEDAEKFGKEAITKAEQYIANRDLIVPRIRLAKSPVDITGGVVVKYGDSETNCSISAMIASVKDKTDARIARVLFP
ncbi:MAG: hypothetical protein IJS78_02835 [Clostridia bacterium]|nr:hypothetical protein [Clostridia bacterium]